MDDNLHLYTQIERYLADELPAAERAAFRERLASDPELAREVELHREIGESITDRAPDMLKTQLRAIHAREFPAPPQRAPIFFLRQKSILAVAASIVLIAAALFYFAGFNDPTPEEIFAEYFEPYPALQYNRDAPSNTDEILRNAFLAYQQKNYSQAIILFDSAQTNMPRNVAADFYLAVSSLAAGDPRRAMDLLQPIAANDSLGFSDPAHWYLALAYLANNDTSAAKAILNDIVRAREPRAEEALQALRQLE